MGKEMEHSPACPDPSRWLEVAAGTESPESTAGLTKHAAECSACASQLREAIRLMADDGDASEEAIVGALVSSRPDWQKEIAQRLSAGRAPVTPPVVVPAPRRTPWWNRRTTWTLAAATAMVMVAWVVTVGPWRATPPVAVERPMPIIAALVLEPVTMRSLGDVVSLKMMPGTEWVDITLQFVDAPPPQFSVQFLDAAEREVWKTELALRDAARQVTVRLPASRLSVGDYHISAGPVTGETGKHVSYSFRITY